MLTIELAHAIRVKEDQRDEYVNRTLIRKPEAELVSANTYRIQDIDQDDSEQERDNKPDGKTQCDKSHICLPVVLVLGHTSPLSTFV
jgi:hypothetical protein